MDRRTELMVSLGTAIGLNCIPCFDRLYAMAREVGLAEKEIQQVAAIAFKVKNGAAMFIKQAVADVVDVPAETEAACCAAAEGKCC
jgi:4-carboxymuconolactone decarboxylase